ncbi:MAG TPA: hypothetical protein VF763_05745 [Candidatus Limnocylindrales bacterium]
MSGRPEWGGGGRFRPDELAGPDGVAGLGPESADLAGDVEAARELEWLAGEGGVVPSAGFVDRISAAIAAEPRPSPAAAVGRAVRRRSVGGVLAALGDAWRVAWSGGRPLAMRGQAFALVLVVVLALGSIGGVAAVGGLSLLGGPAATVSPAAASPSATASPSPSPTPSATPSESPEPSESVEPSGSPGASESPDPAGAATPDGAATPRPTARPTTPPAATETPHPETPGPGQTPEAETPAPTQTSGG